MWGRLFLGVAITQGFYFGVRHAIVAWFTFAQSNPDWISTPTGTTVLQLLQGVGFCISGILVGAGHPRPVAMGFLLGVLNSLMFLFIGNYLDQSQTESMLIGQTGGQLFLSIVAAWVGSRIWRGFPPLVQSNEPGRLLAMDIVAKDEGRKFNARHFRIAWGKVFLGSLIATAGAYWADDIYKGIVASSRGGFQANNSAQAQFIVWELASLFVLFGGGVAGSNTRNGLQHGVLTGALSGLFLVLAYQSLSMGRYESFEFWFDTLDIRVGPGALFPPELAAFLFFSGLIFGTLGGWMGASLLPLLATERRLSDFS